MKLIIHISSSKSTFSLIQINHLYITFKLYAYSTTTKRIAKVIIKSESSPLVPLFALI